jgi:hypothetical protein
LFSDNKADGRAVCSPVQASKAESTVDPLLAEWTKPLKGKQLGVLCPRSLLHSRLSILGWYVTSARLPYVALLSFDIINAGLPYVALLFLLQLKCGAAIPNYSTTPERSS